ncbi:STAS domain-containing protein [Catenuloplanes sp. NPDC051500]|uniref:STAS domain-containing protein n=1 Tax=Catenuloplanes sp. NPDC051500 TaxID=3363959 RepID=UPI0037B1530B
MSTELTFATSERPDGVLVLAVAGEIDMSNAETFADALADTRREAGTFVVDLTRVEYLDSAGLSVLFRHIDQITLVVSPLLAPVLTIAGLDDQTTIKS